MQEKFYRIDCYVPESHLEAVKQALFAAGAGALGNYRECCFSFPGVGEFRPVEGADPFLGRVGEREKVKEWKIEILCSGSRLAEALHAMVEAHPYETPAYQYYPVRITLPEEKENE